MKKYLFYVIAFLFISLPSFAAVPIKVDPNEQASFPFSIQQYIFETVSRNFFVGAHEEIINENDKIFAISYAGPNDSIFFGITPEKIMLNGEFNQENPMYGAKISHLALLGPNPIAVVEQLPQNIYILQNYVHGNNIVALSAENLHDAENNLTAGIVALDSNASRKIFYLPDSLQANEKHPGTVIYAAVKKAGGIFGEKGSGIAVVGVYTEVNEETKESKSFVNILNAQTGEKDGNLAKPFDATVPELFIQNPATKLEDFITFYSSLRHGFYLGAQQTAGAEAGDGVRSIMIAFLGKNGLRYKAIAPESAFASSNDKIVGAVGPGEQVSIHHMASMLTSTWLDYLIVIGGNGDPTSTMDQVYALPIVHNNEDKGAIANKNSIPETVVRMDSRFATRAFTISAKTPDEMPSTTDAAARVGGGPLGAPITQVYTTLDTVFISTDQSALGQQPGIFYSQALFDEYGKIAKWTPWQRAGAVGSVFGFIFDPGSANFTFMKGLNQEAINLVQRTLFGKIEFSAFLENQFPQETGGIQGMIEFPFTTDGFSQIPGERLSIMLWPGSQKVVLSQVGADNNDGNFGPTILKKTFESSDGSLHGFLPDSEITNLSISGGDLSDLGPCITGAEIVADGQGYFFVGGFGGIAVLADQYGHGFDAIAGLRPHFVGLHDQMTFKKLGDFSHVRKLIVDNNTLYVLTDKGLERLTLTANDIANGTVASTRLTDGTMLVSFGDGDSFSDVTISNGFGVIATSAGVYYGSGLSSALHEDEIRWNRIELNDSTRSSTRLVSLSPEKGFDNGGMILVLNAYIGLSYANVYRLIINSSDNNEPVKKVPDIFYTNDAPSYFFSAGLYRNYVATDGATWFVMRSKYLEEPIVFQLYSPGLRSGLALPERRSAPIFINAEGSRAIGPMMRSKTSGKWLIVGDFGIRGNG